MKTTSIKLSDDISGNEVTISFDALVHTAKIATRYAKEDVQRRMSEIENAFFPQSNLCHAELDSERLVNAAKNLHDAIHVLNSLTALTEVGNERKTLYIYGLDQDVEKIVTTHNPN